MRYQLLSALLLLCSFAALLAGCGGETGSSLPLAQQHIIPGTQLVCPEVGKARAAIVPEGKAGDHAQLVYTYTAWEAAQQVFTGFLKSSGGDVQGESELLRLPGGQILESQLADDHQWIILVVQYTDYEALQLVRVDGMGLQTLYCLTGNSAKGRITSLHWSVDKRKLTFYQRDQEQNYILDLTDGTLQELTNSQTNHYDVVRWLDSNQLLLADQRKGATGQALYLLDVQMSSLPFRAEQIKLLATIQAPERNLIVSQDQKTLYWSYCETGWLPKTCQLHQYQIEEKKDQIIMERNALAIRGMVALPDQQIMFYVVNSPCNMADDCLESESLPMDEKLHQQDGLWTMKLDGTDLKQRFQVNASTFLPTDFSQKSFRDVLSIAADGKNVSLQAWDYLHVSTDQSVAVPVLGVASLTLPVVDMLRVVARGRPQSPDVQASYHAVGWVML